VQNARLFSSPKHEPDTHAQANQSVRDRKELSAQFDAKSGVVRHPTVDTSSNVERRETLAATGEEGDAACDERDGLLIVISIQEVSRRIDRDD
jgi:hypothetical protein